MIYSYGENNSECNECHSLISHAFMSSYDYVRNTCNGQNHMIIICSKTYIGYGDEGQYHGHTVAMGRTIYKVK